MPEQIQNTPPDLSVVIVNWNTRELLRDCLASVPQGVSPGHMIEVWVVDNASRDESAAMVTACFPHVRLIANTENAGFARANNQAIRQATGRHVLLLNSDTKVLPGALSAMVGFLDAHPDAGAVGSRLLNSDGTTQRSCWNFYPSLATVASDALYLWRLPFVKNWVRGHEQSLAAPTGPVAVKHLLGACLMVRRAVLDAVGLMDDGYFMYLEETDWCRRMDAAGWQIYYLPTVSIVHYGQQSSGLAPDRANADWCRSLCRFYRQQYRPGPFKMNLMKAVVFASILIRFPLHWFRAISGKTDKPRPSLRGCLVALRALASA